MEDIQDDKSKINEVSGLNDKYTVTEKHQGGLALRGKNKDTPFI